MTKPKLDIRQMIKDGKIDTVRAGQLVSLEVYENSGMLKESDIRALRETAKDGVLYNSYMDGVNILVKHDNTLKGLYTEARAIVYRMAWALSELRFTVRTVYQEQPVKIVTPEAYQRIGQEKRERRLKRTYTLMTLYRIVAENITKNPNGKAQEQAVEALRKEANPDNKEEGLIYGIDLIEQGYEIWAGWTAYHDPHSKDGSFTLKDLANDLSEFHALVMDVIQGLHKAKQLSLDPNSVPLDKWHNTPLKGSELGKLTGIKLLDECLNLPESRNNPLDAYDDEGETKNREDDISDRALFEMYSQKYAIISRPDLYKRELKDGVLDLTDDIYLHDFDMWTTPRLGYGALKNLSKERGIDDDPNLQFMRHRRAELVHYLKLLLVLTKWRERAGELLGIDNGDRFKVWTEAISTGGIYDEYETYRTMYYNALNGEHVTNPEYQQYLELVQETVAPLFDTKDYESLSNEDKAKLFKTKGASDISDYHKNPPQEATSPYVMHLLKDPNALGDKWLAEDKAVQACLSDIENMTLRTIVDTYHNVTDRLVKTEPQYDKQ